jgi:hypothetical protein
MFCWSCRQKPQEKLSMEKPVWVGIDIGGTKTAVVISSSPPVLAGRAEFPTVPENGPKHTIRHIHQAIDRTIAECGISQTSLAGIGVSCGGPLDRVSGVIQSPPNLPTWDNVPLKEILEREFNVLCNIENDANACGGGASLRGGTGNTEYDLSDDGDGSGLGDHHRGTTVSRSLGNGRRNRPPAAHAIRPGRLQKGRLRQIVAAQLGERVGDVAALCVAQGL